MAWRDYVGEDLLQNLPVPNATDSSFKLSPLWVYLFTHVSPLLCAPHKACIAHNDTCWQVFAELTPFKWYITFKGRDIDEESIQEVFDMLITPDLPLVTANLLAYFDYMVWVITQPNGTRTGPDDDLR